jgi:hypothetical protein
MMTRRILNALALVGALLLWSGSGPPALAGEGRAATLFKNPQCGCCGEYVAYLRAHGYRVEVRDTAHLEGVRRIAGVPETLGSCHTMLIDSYVVEGHVPLAAIERLLAERPKIRGISLPGMPEGSPGMSGAKREPFVIYEISEGKPKVYAVD